MHQDLRTRDAATGGVAPGRRSDLKSSAPEPASGRRNHSGRHESVATPAGSEGANDLLPQGVVERRSRRIDSLIELQTAYKAALPADSRSALARFPYTWRRTRRPRGCLARSPHRRYLRVCPDRRGKRVDAAGIDHQVFRSPQLRDCSARHAGAPNAPGRGGDRLALQ